MNQVIIYQGDNREVLKSYPDAYFSSCVCDPPYEMGFMGKTWDKSGIAYDVAMWQEVYRVLKPGAHLLAFGGARTYHRMICAIEDAGFEIRDQIMWLYGSGFPKNLDVSKAMDKAAGMKREVVGKKPGRCGEPKQDIRGGNLMSGTRERIDCSDLTIPATDLATYWDGWGTALKPAHEPICVARKPLEGKVVNNILKHGTGGINVAGCRIECKDGVPLFQDVKERKTNHSSFELFGSNRTGEISFDGRWPANVIHDGSEEVLAEFSETSSGAIKAGQPSGTNFSIGGELGVRPVQLKDIPASRGSAARFFYCAKASPEERNLGCEFRTPSQRDEARKEGNPGGDNPRNRGVRPVKNNHPTVKPLSLMAYLIRLITPPGGIVLDHFMGSGSTLIAAAKEGFDSVGIDLETENCEIAQRRCRGHLGLVAEVHTKYVS